jgi:glycosyltransferase involved in cell wall biosynthesis
MKDPDALHCTVQILTQTLPFFASSRPKPAHPDAALTISQCLLSPGNNRAADSLVMLSTSLIDVLERSPMSPPKPTSNSVTLVLPALNEADAIGEQIRMLRTHPAWEALPLHEILVVDNGSTDDTAAVAREAGARVVCEPRRGYGAACYAGLLAVRSDVLLLMDADGSDDLAGAAQVAMVVLVGAADLAVGSRVRGRVEHGSLTPQQRVGNAVATLLMRALYRLRVSDVGPVRAIRREALLALDPQERTYGWSSEMLVKAARAGYRVLEVPVDYHHRAAGISKVSGTLRGSVRAGYNMLATILRYVRWRPSAPTPFGRLTDTPSAASGNEARP